MNDSSPIADNLAYGINNILEFNERFLLKGGASPSLRKSKDNTLSNHIFNQRKITYSPGNSKMDDFKKKKNGIQNLSIDI